MATRSTISFHTDEVTAHNILIQEPVATLYRHWDGYSEAVIPELLPIVRDFDKHRGASDACYCAARVVQAMLNGTDSPDDAGGNYLGYGLHPAADRFGMGIEYHYTVDPKTVKVWKVMYGGLSASESLQLAETHKISVVPVNLKE